MTLFFVAFESQFFNVGLREGPVTGLQTRCPTRA